MNEIALNLIVFIILLVIGGVTFVLVRRKQVQTEQELIRLATEKGWRYESVKKPLTWGFRLSTSNWMLEAISVSSGRENDSGSPDVSMFTVWRTNSPGSALLIGERTTQVDLGGFGNMLMHQVLSTALGTDAEGLTEIRAGTQAFQQRFMVWAKDVMDVEKTLTPELETILVNWKGSPPLVKRTSAGLSIELRGVHLKKMDDIQRLIHLGNTLLDTI